jgi:GNAT superfamily N-acetyltransferase
MRIIEYDDADPMDVFQVNLLALDFALTPERALQIRQTDPRPFPFFAVCAEEGGRVIGHVGVFRLPLISTEGREDVGGVWAVATHPQNSNRGVASCLLDEAHARMRAAGLRFSTLGTNRFRVAYKLYQQHGYEDTQVLGSTLARWDTAHRPTRLRARPSEPDGFDFVEKLFGKIAGGYLGFAWRHTPFAPLREKVSLGDVWVLWENDCPVGYALAHLKKNMLHISSLLLYDGVEIVEAVAAVVNEVKTDYVTVNASRPVEIASLLRAGWHVSQPSWSAFMVKPLVPEVGFADARRLFGIGSDRFLISWLDMT